MGTQIQDAKRVLRGRIREQLRGMTLEQRAVGSQQARALLAAQPRWQAARSLLFFAPMPGELDVWPLLSEALAAGKLIALPCFSAETSAYVAFEIRDPFRDLRIGQFGVREPADDCTQISLNRLDLALVPGVAFDLQGRRLGRGRGFYDRMLAAMRGTTCGVAFDEQIVRDVPVEPLDVSVNCILTPTRWIEL
jgi:5-formyltetrahydrofolate cyclo-ligase